MNAKVLLFLMATGMAIAAEEKGRPLSVFRELKSGYAAFCRNSIMAELQVIGEPRKLSSEELGKLGSFFEADTTWYEQKEDGTHKGMKTFGGYAHYDFKFLLVTRGGSVISVRLDTQKRSVWVVVNQEELSVPDIRVPAMTELAKILTEWFPGWKEAAARNQEDWERLVRQLYPSSSP